MRLTLDSLIVLDAIDRHGSFAAAAEALHRTPSAVTYAVQKLEEDLGILIFDRSGHRAKLTDADGELLREGRRLLRAADELENRAKRVATGYEVELRIAVDDLIGVERLLPLVEEFYRTEACGTRVRLSTEVYGGTWDALASQRCDLAIGVPAEGPAGAVTPRSRSAKLPGSLWSLRRTRWRRRWNRFHRRSCCSNVPCRSPTVPAICRRAPRAC